MKITFSQTWSKGQNPSISSEKLEDMGFNIVVYPVFALFSSVNSLLKSYQFLFDNKGSKGYSEIVDFKGFEEIIDIKKYKELENKFSC